MEPGDIVAVRDKGLLSDLIVDISGPISHVGMVTPNGVIQALAQGVSTLSIEDTIKNASYAYILHDNTLSVEDRKKVVDYIMSCTGEGYDTLDLVLQAADKAYNTEWFTQHGASDSRVICSELVARSYKAVGRNFGVPDKSATPTDIFNYALEPSNGWAIEVLKNEV